MHCLSEVITNRPWRRLLPVAWLAFAAGCGGLEAGAEASEDPSTQERVPQEAGPITSSGPGTTPPAEAAPQAQSWFHRVGGTQDDLGTGLAVDGSGHVSLVWLSTPRQDADRTPVEGERLALSLARYDSEGQRLWTREFPRNRVDAPRLVASPGGELFLSGNAFLYDIDFGLGAASDGFLVKFSPEGQPLWQRRTGQKVYATAADASGGVFVAAEEWTPEGLLPVLAHHDAQGAFVWTRQLDVVAKGTELRAAARTPSGQWLLAGRLEGVLTVDGQRFGAPGVPSLLLLAFGGDGRLAWGKAWGGVDAHVSGLKADPAGGGVLVGQFSGDLTWGGSRLSGPGAFVLATGAEGTERWAHMLPCGQAPAAPAVALDGQGSVAAVCGDTLSQYTLEGRQLSEQALPPGECSEGNCPVVATALDFVPGHGLALTGRQRHGDAASGDQEAFLRVLAP
jgi:outer membrane protein assembly factor BamB